MTKKHILKSKDKIKRYLSSKGYFNVTINLIENKIRNKKITVAYDINLSDQFLIDSIKYDIDDQDIKKLLEKNKKVSFIRKGTPYDQQNINKERTVFICFIQQRIINLIKVYHF